MTTYFPPRMKLEDIEQIEVKKLPWMLTTNVDEDYYFEVDLISMVDTVIDINGTEIDVKNADMRNIQQRYKKTEIEVAEDGNYEICFWAHDAFIQVVQLAIKQDLLDKVENKKGEVTEAWVSLNFQRGEVERLVKGKPRMVSGARFMVDE